MTELNNRYEFVVLFDVENGNPNGDPDAGNMPRVDIETNYGLVSDVCIKRKIRNYVQTKFEDKDGYKIFIKDDAPLNTKQQEAYTELGIKDSNKKKVNVDARTFMCEHYFDIRTFGAVMTTGDYNCGQVRGPVQINFAKSFDPVFQSEITITRQAPTDQKDFDGKANTMGRKHIIPYGLYKTEGYISANLAKQTGFSQEDLELLFEAVENMFEHDHSASRGKMCVRKLIVFKHESALGNTQSYKLFDLIKVHKKSEDITPRSFDDYDVFIDRENLPSGVEIIERI